MMPWCFHPLARIKQEFLIPFVLVPEDCGEGDVRHFMAPLVDFNNQLDEGILIYDSDPDYINANICCGALRSPILCVVAVWLLCGCCVVLGGIGSRYCRIQGK